MRIVGVQIAAAKFFDLVFTRSFRMGAQIVPEGQVPGDFRRTLFEAMQLHDPVAALQIVRRAIPTPGKAEFPPPGISEVFNNRTSRVEGFETAYDRYQIQNRLGVNAGYRGRADVMDGKNCISGGGYQPVAFPPRPISPRRIMRHKVYGNGRRHLQIDQCHTAGVDRFAQEDFAQMGKAARRIGRQEARRLCRAIVQQ